jgi:hypothetical protein
LSHQTPPEVWVEENSDHLIRKRGKYEDYLTDLIELSRAGDA